MQRAKAKAAQDQAVMAEKAATAAAKKVKQLEAEIDELREKHRKTPEAALVQQIAELKGQLADSERRIEAVKAEKSQILQDKEKFRVNVKKLVRPLCRTMLEELVMCASDNSHVTFESIRPRRYARSVIRQLKGENRGTKMSV